MNDTLQLYVYSPNGHGSLTFAVVASSEAEAYALVDARVRAEYSSANGVLGYYSQGWGTDYYTLEVLPAGQVFEHENS